MLLDFAVLKDSVYVPTVAKTEAGFYQTIEPVAVVKLSDRQGLIDALKAGGAFDSKSGCGPSRDSGIWSYGSRTRQRRLPWRHTDWANKGRYCETGRSEATSLKNLWR
jgi:hypothetical protein